MLGLSVFALKQKRGLLITEMIEVPKMSKSFGFSNDLTQSSWSQNSLKPFLSVPEVLVPLH